MKVTKSGQWKRAGAMILAAATRLQSAINGAVTMEAHRARKEAIQGISRGAPGGKKFKPLADTTRAVRRALRGTKRPKPLQETGEFKKAIVVRSFPSKLTAFCGILRQQRGTDGRPLVNVAAVHEFGAGPFAVAMTNRSRRFFFWAIGTGGLATDQTGGHEKAFVITVPPRPVFGPVWDMMRGGSRSRIEQEVQRRMWGGIR